MSQLALDSGTSGAEFSHCGTYRYLLWRSWGVGDSCLFVMLNPSTADETVDDPTIRRCIGFARRWGFAGVEVVNIFALRSTDPRALRKHPDPTGGERNDFVIDDTARRCPRVVCAWGIHGWIAGRGAIVHDRLCRAGVEPLAFKVTKTGQPAHPLYQPGELEPRPFRMEVS